MASQPAAPRLRLAAALAVVALLSEGAAWWWAGSSGLLVSGSPSLLLGLAGIVLATLAIWMLLHINWATGTELRKTRMAAARAFEHEQAMQRAQQEALKAGELLAQANEQLSRQSATDGLTSIANRRKFDETLAIEWLRAARSGTGLGLLMVDIDHFKRYNDHYGHVAGDECLRRVAQVLSTCVRRAGELLARYGGEEFVLLLPGASLERAHDMAQRCLNAMRSEAIAHGASPTAPMVSFSIGVAHIVPSAAQDPETLVNAADTAMYRAKMAGRSRYAVAGPADWEIDKDAPRS